MISPPGAARTYINMQISEERFRIPTNSPRIGLLDYLERSVCASLPEGARPIRFLVSKTDDQNYHAEVGVLPTGVGNVENSSIFSIRRREVEHESAFNGVLLIPTGIGAEIGGHAGDATPVARLLAAACDTLVLHPNVVNASDLNEMPVNSLYVEGSVITRLLMGTVGIKKVRSNRVLLLIDDHQNTEFVDWAVNSVNAARASGGYNIVKVVKLDPPIKMTASYSESGRATGSVSGIERALAVIEEFRDDIDAVAIASVVQLPEHYHAEYFRCEGDMLNPWGGVEALLTHTISTIAGLPAAHSPMFESQEIATMQSGLVDPRMAAEALSDTFLHCILKGLARAPQIVPNAKPSTTPGMLTVEDISCLVIPDGCLGIPTLAALEQGIPVIAVKENKNIMKNDLTALPWKPGKFFKVETYLEAAGLMLALREGVALDTLKRPLLSAEITRRTFAGARMRNKSLGTIKKSV
jgi:hypothetical protein